MPCYNNIIKNTRDTKHYEQMIPNQMINKLKDCEVDFMKAVIAIDSFKGSLSSFEAGNSAAEGIRRVYPDAQIEVRPLADGGEGTVEALTLGCAGQLTTVTVTGPLGKPVSCQYGIVDSTRTAIIEMSGAAGITLVPDTERNPLYTTTYGVGEVIRDAITKGCRHFIVGIGGSATNDGGVGMLQALGYAFLDKDGKQVLPGARGLKDITEITAAYVIPELAECKFRVACDVTNPLCGELGCSSIYGPQKGATPEMIQDMDQWLGAYAELAKERFPKADAKYPGTGAAGGMGFAFLTFTDAVLESGINIVLDETKLEDYIKDADLVITGEGRMDGQTAMGKAPVGIAKMAKKHGAKVIALAGAVIEGAQECNEQGIDAYFPILRQVVTLDEAMDPATARKNMVETTEQVMRLVAAVK